MSHLSISNSKKHGLFNFSVRVSVFFLPLFVLIGLFEFSLFRTGESWPVALVAFKQMGMKEFLYGRKYISHNFFYYKRQVLKNKHADIVVLGSSRVMQVRDFMFNPLEHVVYNYGGLVRNVYEFKSYCEYITTGKNHKPKVVILGIDPWWFNKMRSPKNRFEKWQFLDWLPEFTDHLRIGLNFIRKQEDVPWDAVFKGWRSKSPYFGFPSIGIAAIQEGRGFRSDGSRQYDPKILLDFITNPFYRDREVPPVIVRVKRPGYLTGPDPILISVLIDSLNSLAKKGIEVYTFMPPFSTEVLQELESNKHTSNVWKKYKKELPKILMQNQIPCIAAIDPSFYEMEDTCMFDGMHPSEVFMARCVLDIIRNAQPGSFLKKVNLTSLEEKIEGSANSPLSFSMPNEIGLKQL